MTSLLKGRTYW